MEDECAYCCRELCEEGISLLIGLEGQRSCSHFVHTRCGDAISGLDSQSPCPTCGELFINARAIPDPLANTDAWLMALDPSGSGHINRRDAIAALSAAFPFDALEIEEGEEQVTRNNCEQLICKVQRRMLENPRPYPPPIPDIRRANAWFNHWDVNGVGSLTFEDTNRALLKTFRSHNAGRIRRVVQRLWAKHQDPEGCGITRDRLLRQDTGLLDAVLMELARASWINHQSDNANPKVSSTPISPPSQCKPRRIVAVSL